MLKINSQNNRPFFLLFVTLIIFISISIPVEAGTPKVSVSASFSSQVNPGDTPQLDVSVSETGGQDWVKDATVEISVSPSNGIYLSKTTSNTVARINKLSSAHFTFPIQVLDNAPSGEKTIHITVRYYEMDIFNIETYGPYFVTLSKTFYVNEQYGAIEIASNPSGANVYLDGVYKGTAPLNINNVLIGSHTIKLTKSGYNDVSSTVTVNSDQTAFVSKQIYEIPAVKEQPAMEEEYVYEEVPIDDYSTNSNTIDTIVGAILLASIFGIFGMILKKSKKSNGSADDATSSAISKTTESKEPSKSMPASTATSKENRPINTSSAFGYKGATIQYKIKIENPTSEPIGDIKIHIFVPDVFLLENIEKSISMLEPNESKTVTFEIRPTGECGDCNVSGRVNYYDYGTKKRQEIDLETKSLSVVCPLLKVKNISITEWRNLTRHLVKTEETTREISMPAETLFSMASRVIEDMNMFMLEPEITSTEQMFNGVARFYGEGVKELKYAAQIEVVGGAKRSKLILKAWAEREDALTGFYHGILDELEKRVNVKGYIDDSIVQNFYHYGDNIGTQVKDSFVQRSNIGTGADVKKCPNCSRDVDANEKFCLECGTKL